MRKFGIAAIALAFTGSAYAADMPIYVKAPPYVPAATWTGFYIGADAGVARLHETGTWNPLPNPAAFGAFGQSGSTGGTGAVGGFHAGYNWQFATSWVAGIEGDYTWASGGGSSSQPWVNPAAGAVILPGSFTNMQSALQSLSTARVRLGYLLMPNLLAYGTGGGAWGRIQDSASNSNAPNPAPYNAPVALTTSSSGWVAGGGLEWMLDSHWVIRAEYLRYHLASAQNVTTAGPPGFVAFPSNYVWSASNIDVGRVGLSYKF
jgi:outer membrane immunogenic protein